MIRDIDLSHQRAFQQSIAALGRIHERSHRDQLDVLGATMDMIHGPQETRNQQGGDMTVDEPRFDLRPAWMPDDDAEDGGLLYSDPTDDLMPDPPTMPPNVESDDLGPADMMGYARSVRPGEGLIQ